MSGVGVLNRGPAFPRDRNEVSKSVEESFNNVQSQSDVEFRRAVGLEL